MALAHIALDALRHFSMQSFLWAQPDLAPLTSRDTEQPWHHRIGQGQVGHPIRRREHLAHTTAEQVEQTSEQISQASSPHRSQPRVL
jgi:hypothetical protein